MSFVLQMAWIALSSSYPMLFDEEYHVGIIDIYSRQLGPFITSQPPEAAFHGDITRYSSYFFHYLMSFPYRLIAVFTQDLMTKVIIMRFICIALVIIGVWLFRKVILNFGVSKATANAVILIFTLIPMVPFALCQVNYDALVFALLPLLLYFSQKASQPSDRQVWYIILLGITSGFAAVTKFTTLPVIFACIIFVGTYLYRQHKTTVLKVLWRQVRLVPRLQLVIASLFLVISLGLFVERYVVNLVTYHSIEPTCDVLHTDAECLQYTVYQRNSDLKKAYQANPHKLWNPIQYSVLYWIPHVFDDSFVTGTYVYPTNQPTTAIRTLPPDLSANAGNPLLRFTGWAVFVVSVLVVIVASVRCRLVPQRLFYLFGLVIIIYSAALWLKNYTDYLSLGSPVAAQGRYYICLLIPMLLIVVLCFKQLVKDVRAYPYIFLISVLFLLTQSGGVSSFVLYSNPKWYWFRDQQAITQVNTAARKIIRPLIIFH